MYTYNQKTNKQKEQVKNLYMAGLHLGKVVNVVNGSGIAEKITFLCHLGEKRLEIHICI